MKQIRYSTDTDATITLVTGMGCLTAFLFMAAAWATHVIWIIKTLASDKGATVGQMFLGVLGSLVPPVGVVHGVLIWTGV